MPIGNNSIFGAFTLGEVRSGRLTGEWLHPDAVANYGWFGGGVGAPGTVSTVDRIDFSNDSVSASPRGLLSLARYGLTATGNSNYGWFGGGFPAILTVDRIDFSNDVATATARGSLGLGRWSSAATGNSNYGWFGGGIIPGTPVTINSTVDRVDFSNDSPTASPRGPLSLARSGLAATGNSNYGWFSGGTAPGPTFYSTVDRIDFSNDSAISSPRGLLGTARTALAATGNSNYGWFGGGSPASTTSVSRVDRIDFSNDSETTSVRGTLSAARYFLAATGNSNYGWFGGGANFPGPIYSSTVDRIDFSNDSVSASSRGLLSISRGYNAATSGVLNIRRQKAANFGWFGAGQNSSSSISTVDRIDFSNDSATASPRGSFNVSKYNITATGNSNYGWFGGGYIFPPGAPVSTVDRIDFSNDSAAALARGPLSAPKDRLAATGNSNYGWFGSNGSAVYRIDFSNDSSTTSLRGRLSSARYASAATGNSNYGWFSSGANSVLDRIDFSNDSSISSVRGRLSSARYNLAATGNSNYGWFGAGSGSSTVDRIDFSNDSATASPRTTLSSARYLASATGNSNYGWFGGGQLFPSPGVTSAVQRIDFSNDSATASPRGSFNAPKCRAGATSNTPIG